MSTSNNNKNKNSYYRDNNDNNRNDSIVDLGMLQLADSFFPTGMYTMSNGLEAIFYGSNTKKKKMDASELHDLIKTFLEQQVGPADCTALGNACEYASASNISGLLDLDRIVVAMRPVQEIRSASIRSGTQLLKCVSSFVLQNNNNNNNDDSNNDNNKNQQDRNKILLEYTNAIRDQQAFGPYPVALAVAANALSIPKHKAGLMMLYSFSVSVVAAALRLGMMQHFDGQKVLSDLKPTITATVESFINRPLEGIWQFAPHVDIIQISHERMSSKMFIT